MTDILNYAYVWYKEIHLINSFEESQKIYQIILDYSYALKNKTI